MPPPGMYRVIACNRSRALILIALISETFRTCIEGTAEGWVIRIELKNLVDRGRGGSGKGTVEKVVIEILVGVDNTTGTKKGCCSFVLFWKVS